MCPDYFPDFVPTKAAQNRSLGIFTGSTGSTTLLSVPRYDFGWSTYGRSRIAAHMGRVDEAMRLLARARVEGIGALSLVAPYASDPLLYPLRDVPEFKALVRNLP